jgi:DNA-directed RNA polymerase sigma subunit (sigma70/sigma32)
MDLIEAVLAGLVAAVGAGIGLDLVRGTPARLRARLDRALAAIPGDVDRARWREELQTVLALSEGRPLKLLREGRQVIRAAMDIARMYAPEVSDEGNDGADAAWAERTRLSPGLSVPGIRREMLAWLEWLEYRERRIIELRYGLADQAAMSLERVAKKFNLTVDRIAAIERQSLKKLESLVEANNLRRLP